MRATSDWDRCPYLQGGSPNPNGTSSSSASPKTKPADGSTSPQAQGPPNPFFGTRVLKKGPPVYIKEDFNPFKYHKVVEAAQVGKLLAPLYGLPYCGKYIRVKRSLICRVCAAPMWPYQGKRYMQMFPPLQVQPQQQSPHMAPPPPPPMPPPSYEEDSAAQAAARGYVYAPYPYGYPGQVSFQWDEMVRLRCSRYLYVANDAWDGAAPTGCVYPRSAVHATYAISTHASERYVAHCLLTITVVSIRICTVIAMYPTTPMGQMPRKTSLITSKCHS